MEGLYSLGQKVAITFADARPDGGNQMNGSTSPMNSPCLARHWIAILASCLALTMPAVGSAENSLSKISKLLKKLNVQPAAGELIVNGGFEEPAVGQGTYVTFQVGQSFPGWQVVGVGAVSPISGAYAQSGIAFNAGQGSQWLDMTGPGTNQASGVQQTVRTQAGAQYELVFLVGNVTGGMFGPSSAIEVVVDGRSVGTARNAANGGRSQVWQQSKIPLTATGPSMTIAFINRDPGNDNSNGLDGVSLRAVGAAATAGSAVLTESFESPATGNYTTYSAGQSFNTGANTWIVPTSSIDIVNARARREVSAFDGTQAVDLTGSPGAGVLATSFATTRGQRYDLGFQYARNNGLRNTPGRATVEVVGATTLLSAEVRHDTQAGPFNAFRAYAGSFVADGASATLRFTSLNPGVAGILIDAISVRPAATTSTGPAVPAASNVAGEYTYLGQGKATFTQSGDYVHGYSTWAPSGAGPHYEFKGTVAGDRIAGEWYSIFAQKGWYKWAAKIQPNGDLDFAGSEDPIRANVNKAYLSKQR